MNILDYIVVNLLILILSINPKIYLIMPIHGELTWVEGHRRDRSLMSLSGFLRICFFNVPKSPK